MDTPILGAATTQATTQRTAAAPRSEQPADVAAQPGDSIAIQTYTAPPVDYKALMTDFVRQHAETSTPVTSVTVEFGSLSPQERAVWQETMGVPVLEGEAPRPVEHKKLLVLDGLQPLSPDPFYAPTGGPDREHGFVGLGHQKMLILGDDTFSIDSRNMTPNGEETSLLIKDGPLFDAFMTEWNRAK